MHPLTKTNYLASLPLAVVYALADSTVLDITTEPIGLGKTVYLKDIWLSDDEVNAAIRQFVTAVMFQARYADVFTGTQAWQRVEVNRSERYAWNVQSAYIRKPTFFDGLTTGQQTITPLVGIRVLALFGDSVTTFHRLAK